MSDKPIPERIWIAGYVAGDSSGALTRGLYFRSIHDSLSDAERCGQHRKHAEGFIVTEYVAEARVRELEQALERYGYHDEGCPADTIKDGQCLCGLDAALAALPVTDKAVKNG